MLYKNHEMIDLTGNSLLDEKPSKAELLAPCSVKRCKVLGIEQDAVQHTKNTQEHASGAENSQSSYPFTVTRSEKNENLKVFDGRGLQNAQLFSPLWRNADETVQKRGAQILSQENKDVQTSAVPFRDNKARGSAYLDQVREKLSAAEYKEFVGYMKALKSKVMKTGHVLQSIFQLFSEPERLPLLRRFEDYVAANYRSLYEQYVERNNDTQENQSDKLL